MPPIRAKSPWMMMMMMIAGLLWAGACAGRPLGPAPKMAQLTIINPRGLVFLIESARDPGRPVAGPTASSGETFEFHAGAYVVRVRGENGETLFPAPLFPDVRGGADVHIRIHDRPRLSDASLRFIPAGPALIGDLTGVGQEDERPAAVRRTDAFLIGARETTNAEYAEFLNEAGAVDPAWCALESQKFRIHRDTNGRFVTDRPAEPVVMVSAAGAEAFAHRLTQKSGRVHRLPTEAEWEKAARGPESFVYSYGDVYRKKAANQESGHLMAVGTFPPNAYGLFDVTGNAFEWTADVYTPQYGSSTTTRVGEGPSDLAPDRVLRGGSFVLDGMYLRNSFRMRQRPGTLTDDFGFRIAADLTASERESIRCDD